MNLDILKRKPVVTGVCFIVLYVLVAQLSLTLSFQNSNASPIWPPSGLAVFLIFVLGPRLYPAIFAAALLANILTFAGNTSLSFSTISASFLIGIGNTLEAYITYIFFKMALDHEQPLKNPISFLVFVIISMASCFGYAFYAAFILWVHELVSSSVYNTVLLTWWLGDFIGTLTIGSFLLSLNKTLYQSKGKQLEYILTLISLSIFSIVIFSNHDPNSLISRFYFILLPIFIWITFRFNLVNTLFSINLMAILATLGTANDKGPFQSLSVNDSLLLMQCFIGSITVTFILFKLQTNKNVEGENLHDGQSVSLKAQWLALLTFCMSIFITIIFAGNYASKDKEKVSILVINELDNVNNILKKEITSTIQALQRLADRQVKLGKLNSKQWKNDSDSYLKHFGIIESLDLTDSKNKTLMQNHINQDNSVNNFTTETKAAISKFLERQGQSNTPTFSMPFILKDKLVRFIIRIPSTDNSGKIIGSIVAVCLYDKMMDKLLGHYSNDFVFEIKINDKTIYQTQLADNTEFEVSRISNLYNLRWTLIVNPTVEKLQTLRHKEWGIHILIGLILSILLTTTIYQSINSGSKALALQEMNNKLNSKNGELIKQRIASRQAAQAKDTFLTNMSHEIRTPMNGVLGALQLAKECSKDELQQYLRVIDVSAKSLMEIIDEILEYSSLESGEISIETIDFNLATLVQDSIKIIESAATVKGLGLNIYISDNMPEYVQGDPVRLKQIILNLLSNALKFTDKGSITVSVSEDFNETVKIEVKDTGIGIAEHQIKKIFNHFEQLDMTSTRGIGGAGLGLSICRSLTGMMAGSINVISKENEGSNFIVKIPLIPGQKPQKKNHIAKSDLACKTILVCEDNQSNSLIMKKMLEKLGVQVLTAEDGRKSLSTLVCEWEKIDLVLMDLQMPHLGGLEVATVIKEQIPNFNVPIVALTANCSAEDREECERAGMKGFLAKPISKEKLADELDRWIEI